MPSVYLSHSNVDKEFARRLADDLKRAGVRVWLEDFKPGYPIDESMRKGIEDIEYFAFLLSPNSVQPSSMARQELEWALEKQTERKTVGKIVPLLLENCDLPDSLKNTLYIDFRDPMRYQEALNSLFSALGAQPAEPAETTRRPATEPGNGDVLEQPLSAWAYAAMVLVGLVGAVALTMFYVYQGPRIAQSGAQGLVALVLQVLIALACAIFLFGAMKSTGRFTSKSSTFGGPAALFIVVLSILFARGQPGELFDLTVRAHSADGSAPIIRSGEITIDLDNDRRHGGFNSNGEADFKGIPAKFRGATVDVLPQVDGYKQDAQRLKLSGAVLDVTLQPAPPPVTHLTGSIVPPPRDWASLRITVDGQPKAEGHVDKLGRFDFQVNGKDGDTVRLKIYEGTKLVYDNFQTVPGPLNIPLRRK